jgi:hypothetical protein
VVKQEIEDILCKVRHIYKEVLPKIGFIILNKKTNSRIFKLDKRNGFDNPEPGTVADDVITLPER